MIKETNCETYGRCKAGLHYVCAEGQVPDPTLGTCSHSVRKWLKYNVNIALTDCTKNSNLLLFTELNLTRSIPYLGTIWGRGLTCKSAS